MKFYQMSDKVVLETWDGREPAGLFRRSHDLMLTKTGSVLVNYTNNEVGEPFKGELICDLDDEGQTGILPTFFTSPALIGTKQFYQALLDIGITNIETHPVVIRDKANNRTIDDYVLLNIIGRVSCAVMEQSGHEHLNNETTGANPHESTSFINDLVIDGRKAGNLDLFLAQEDTNCILVSERVFEHVRKQGYHDVFFEEVKQISSAAMQMGRIVPDLGP